MDYIPAECEMDVMDVQVCVWGDFLELCYDGSELSLLIMKY